MTAETIAKRYKLDVDDTLNLLHYFHVYQVQVPGQSTSELESGNDTRDGSIVARALKLNPGRFIKSAATGAPDSDKKAESRSAENEPVSSVQK